MTGGGPVRKLQPATSAPCICAYSLSISGVSRSGSTVMEANATLLPKSGPSRSCTSDIIGVSTGQVALHNGEDEGYGHHLAAKVCEGNLRAILRGQRESWRRRDLRERLLLGDCSAGDRPRGA